MLSAAALFRDDGAVEEGDGLTAGAAVFRLLCGEPSVGFEDPFLMYRETFGTIPMRKKEGRKRKVLGKIPKDLRICSNKEASARSRGCFSVGNEGLWGFAFVYNGVRFVGDDSAQTVGVWGRPSVLFDFKTSGLGQLRCFLRHMQR